MEKEIVIGIDLGLRNSRVGYLRRNQDGLKGVDILANKFGNRHTPSVVAFSEVGRLVGEQAKDAMYWNPENTVHEARILLGRKMGDEEVQNKIKQWPFKVLKDPRTSKPLISVMNRGTETLVTPEQISAAVLLDIIKTAEDSLDTRGKITKAVITVPAYFNEAQRTATIDAAKIAGLEEVKIIEEPIAAAMAYGFEGRNRREQNILVYDFGESSLNVTIVAVMNKQYKVKATTGSKDLGGSDFDAKLKDHLMKNFQRRHNVDLSNDKRAQLRLLKECELAKRELSKTDMTRVIIRVENISNGINLETNVIRAKLEDVCSDLLDMAIEPLQETLDSANLFREDIDEVILVGGSTRIPAIQERLSEFFGGKSLNKSIEPEEAVACGAAIYAADLQK